MRLRPSPPSLLPAAARPRRLAAPPTDSTAPVALPGVLAVLLLRADEAGAGPWSGALFPLLVLCVVLLAGGAAGFVLNRRAQRRMAEEGRARTEALRQSHEALAASEERYRTLFDTSRDGIVYFDADGGIEGANTAFLEMLGYGPDELERLIGRTEVDLTPDAWHADDERVFVQELLRRGWAEEREKEYKRKDGGTVTVTVRTWRLPGRDAGEEARTWSIARDVTERRRLESALGQSQKLEAVGRLACDVAHEFNNLLVPILGSAERLRTRLDGGATGSDPEVLELVEDIRHASEGAGGLCSQLLAFGRRDPTPPQSVDACEVVRRMEPMLRRLLDERIRLSTLASERTPRVRVDPSKLELAVMNLVLNARDAMLAAREGKSSCGTLTIELARTRPPREAAVEGAEEDDASWARISVHDEGAGFVPEVLEHAFEPFITTKPTGEGTGLGLATVYAIATSAGGHASIESHADRGTTVHLVLPPAEAGTSEAQPPAAPPPGGEESVLVCEDDERVRSMVVDSLREGGYQVVEAEDAKEALAHFAALGASNGVPALDLLLTDVVMPGMDGRELAEAILGESPDTAVLFMSGYSSKMLGPGTVEAARSGFLTKPFGPSVLLRTVRGVLDGDEASESGASELDGAHQGGS